MSTPMSDEYPDEPPMSPCRAPEEQAGAVSIGAWAIRAANFSSPLCADAAPSWPRAQGGRSRNRSFVVGGQNPQQ
eukprot:8530334-Pyramimonas_sp.AAC.1